jgi:hypothetical protein
MRYFLNLFINCRKVHKYFAGFLTNTATSHISYNGSTYGGEIQESNQTDKL